MKLQKAVFSGLALLLAGTAQAGDYDLLFQGGIDVGGDELFHATYTNGDTVSIDAGDLLQLGVGFTFKTAPARLPELETQMSLSYKFDSANAQNGDVDWKRYPIELMEFYTTPSWRFGGGLAYHLNPSMKGSGVAAVATTDFDNALGLIFEVDYIIGAKSYIGGRVTLIDYTTSDTNQELSGNSVGITFGWRP